MSTPEAITYRETWGAKWLWVGVLTGPIAWAIQLGGDWFLAEVVACRPASGNGTVGPFSLLAATTVLNSLLLLATLVAGLVAARWVRALRGTGDGVPEQRARWMARSGVINSATFALIIVASYLVVAVDTGCGS